MKEYFSNPKTITGQIYAEIFQLLEKNSDGIRWKDLINEIISLHPNFHPKTINGCIWKLLEKYPEEIYKPEKGIFRLKKFQKETIKSDK